MKHLISCIVRSSCNDAWLDSKMYQLTLCQQHQLIDGHYPIFTLNNFNEIYKHINDAKWLFIESAGDYIVDLEHVWSLLHSIPDNVGLIGHILWDPVDSDPYLHHQCIIINTAALKGKNIDFYSKLLTGKQFTRSELSMHGNYCPAWVKLNDSAVPRNSRFGTDIMSLILENGYDVINFDSEWRSVKNIEYLSHMPSRGYFSPELGTELFSHCLKNLIVDDRLELEQREAIRVFKNESEYNILNALHWDGYPKDNEADLVISPANGLMGECIANTNNANKIIFYDVNKNNIDFKRKLYTEWDGKDYEKFYMDFATERNLIIDPYTERAKENANKQMPEVNNVINNWDKFKQMQVEFIHCDIIDAIDSILEKMTNKTILHTSTILNYYLWSNLKHDLDEVHNTRNKITEKIKDTGSIWYETY